mmetsp:Transcript_20714/g.39210  ORF Transcript_20714/g.39210 Transcript_20714/m.39210 type:complete len:96 (-) Transcript_20714:131-418(-)
MEEGADNVEYLVAQNWRGGEVGGDSADNKFVAVAPNVRGTISGRDNRPLRWMTAAPMQFVGKAMAFLFSNLFLSLTSLLSSYCQKEVYCLSGGGE